VVNYLLDLELGNGQQRWECWFNGKLTSERDNKPTYVDGIVKPMRVRNQSQEVSC